MLAIIIPYYKLTFFKETLQSLENQTDKRFKVYIGDDASPEEPKYLLEKYKGKFDFIYHRFNENIGKISLVKQWERCIDLIDKEEWIMILGDDDVLGKEMVAEFYYNLSEIKKEGINVIRFASQVVDSDGKGISAIFEHPKLEKAADSFWRRFKGKTRSSLSEYIFSRESHEKFGFKNYPLAWHSDDIAWLEFSEEKAIFSINEAFLEIRISSESISGKKDNLIKKNKAEAQFFMDLVRSKLRLFSKSQRLQLLYQAEASIKKTRLLTHSEWFSLLIGYLCNFSILPIIKFLRRYLLQ